jgi:hypothetical protein
MSLDLQSHTPLRLLAVLALVCLVALSWACAEAPGEPECPGANWDRSPCEDDSYYVVYADVLPYRETMQQLADGTYPDIGVSLREFCEQGAGIGLWEEYDGDGKPERRFYSLTILLPDSGTAEATRPLLGPTKVVQDTEGYYDFEWMVTTTLTLSAGQVDSLTALLAERSVDVNDLWTDDDNALLFFGTCLTREVAHALRDQLQKREVPVQVLQLEYQELDI